MTKDRLFEKNRKFFLLSGCFMVTAILAALCLALPIMDGGKSLFTHLSDSMSEGPVFALRVPPAKSALSKPVSAEVEAEAVYSRMDVETLSLKVPPFTKAHRPGYDTMGFTYMPEIPLSYDLQEYTYIRCKNLDIEYEMVLAIMWRESMFLPEVVGTNQNGTQDSGLMQINDVNRGWLEEKHGIDDLLDPYQNVDAGTIILSQYFEKYGENQALMAYQYGEQGMLERWEKGMRTNRMTELVKNKRDEFLQMRLGEQY